MGATSKMFHEPCSMLLGAGILFVLSLMACPASAQVAGTILGVVEDASGGAVPGARITITNVDTSEARTVASGDDGAFRVPGLRPGHYSVRVEKDGFKTSTETALSLNVAQELVVNPALQVGSATQEVTVTGEPPVINTTTSSLGSLVDDQRISDLPLNGRNYLDLTLIQPGVQVNTHPSGGGSGAAGTWISTNGLPPRSNNFTLDGAIINNQYGTGANSIAGNTLGVDGIKEYRVVTNNFSAEYGLTTGSQMVIVSKGGSNRWHGDVFEYLRNNHLDARNFFEAQPSLLGGQRLSQFKRNNFGAAFGGPIRKDKTFFYLVYEGLRTAQQDAIQDTTLPEQCHFVNVTPPGGGPAVPVIIGGGPLPASGVFPDKFAIPAGFSSANQQILKGRLSGTVTMATTGCGSLAAGANITGSNPATANMTTPWIGQFPFPNENIAGSNYTYPGSTRVRDDYGQIRVDHTFSASDTFFSRYTLNDTRLVTPYNNLSSADTGNGYPQFFSLGLSRNQYVTFGENHIFSSTLLNSGRLSFSRTNFIGYPGINRDPGLNPDFDMIDTANTPGSTCFATTNPVCIWSYLPGRFNGGFVPGQGVTTLSFNNTFPTYHPQNVWTLADDVFLTRGKHAFKLGILMNNYQDSSQMQKGAYGALNSGNNITNWMTGKTTSFLSVTPVPGFSTNGVLNPPYQGRYLDRSYMFKTFGFYAQDDYRATSRLTLNLGLRYEFQTVPHELYRRSSIIPDLLGGSPTYKTGGIFNHNWTLRNWSPRVGFAWDVRGNGRTSVRGGFGIYWDIANIGSLLTQAANGVPPFSAQTQVAQSAKDFALPFVDVNGNPNAADFGLSQFGKALQMNDPNLQNPHVLQYNLTVEQQLPGGIGLQVSYVGNRGINLFSLIEGNPVVPNNLVNGQLPPNTMPTFNVNNGEVGCQNNALTSVNGVTQPLIIPGVNGGNPITPSTTITANGTTGMPYPCRRNPYWTSALFITSPSNSWYSGLQVLAVKRLSHGLDFQASYTYSRSIDTTAGQMYNTDCGGGAIGTAVGFNPTNLKLDKGLSCSDVPHSMRLSVLYHLPNMKSGGILSKVLNGWYMGNIVSLSQGFPFTPLITLDRSFSGVITQANSTKPDLNTAAVSAVANPAGGTYNWIPYDPKTVITGDPNHWFNVLMFGEGPLGRHGNTPRDVLRMPGLTNWDFSLIKDTKLGVLGEQGNLQFRAEFFNLMNHANFGIPNGTAFAGTLANTAAGGNAGGNIQAPVGASASNPLGTAGQITTTATNSRQIQLALKIMF